MISIAHRIELKPNNKCTAEPTPLCTFFLHHTPIQLVVPSVVRIAVMILAMTCKSVFHPSFFIAFSF